MDGLEKFIQEYNLKRVPVFKTFTGKNIYLYDSYYYINLSANANVNCYEILSTNVFDNRNQSHPVGAVQFTKDEFETAKKYLELYTPVLSINDVTKIIPDIRYKSPEDIVAYLCEYVKNLK